MSPPMRSRLYMASEEQEDRGGPPGVFAGEKHPLVTWIGLENCRSESSVVFSRPTFVAVSRRVAQSSTSSGVGSPSTTRVLRSFPAFWYVASGMIIDGEFMNRSEHATVASPSGT